jgi:cation diffusion facilitator CzcD-associated flavoprotein CzcO
MTFEARTQFDAIVIGAGFSGLAILHHLREIGLDTVVLDAQDGVGGTWLANRYPGVRTDSEYSYYSFSFSKEVRDEWTWSQRYASGPEVLAYLNFVADRLDLRRDIRLDTRVQSARYAEETNTWTVQIEGGAPLVAKYLISAMGILSHAIYPDIPGLDTFAGEKYHTAHWPRGGADLKGKRVGVIGLGSSGVQVVPAIAPQVDELIVFQRTPNYVVETTNEALTADDMTWLRENYDAIYEKAVNHPFAVAMELPSLSALEVSDEERRSIFESKWNQGGFHFGNECFTDLATNPAASELASEFIRSKIREIVKDPATADMLSPTTYSFNGKRVPTGHGYYDTFNRDNVRLVDIAFTPISEATPCGLRVGDTEYELDVLIFATGFDAVTGSLTEIDIIGRDGITLADKWARDGMRTNLGVSVNGFPNFFMSLGPQTVAGNVVVPIQLNAQWLQRALRWARDNDVDVFEATPESEEWWTRETESIGKATVVYSEGKKANSWFLGGNVPGKPEALLVYLGGLPAYLQHCRELEESGYASMLAASRLADPVS